MSIRIRHGFALAAALSFMLSAGGVDAAHFGEPCAEELNTLEQAILAAYFKGGNAETNRNNLLAKLEAAAVKLAEGKTTDAIDKLQDISDKATDWANAPKPKLDDARDINNGVVAAMRCAAAQ